MEVPEVQQLSSQEMDMATRVQILGETDYISHSTNTLEKGMNPIILPLAMGKQQGRLGSSALERQLVQEKKNSEIKPVKLRLKKLTLCHILPERRGWVNMINSASYCQLFRQYSFLLNDLCVYVYIFLNFGPNCHLSRKYDLNIKKLKSLGEGKL